MTGTANFSLKEFGCSCGCGENKVNLGLLEALQEVRDSLGEPMKITSGYRCEAHNMAVGGVNTSSHLKGWAADLAVHSSSYAYDIMEALFETKKFHRIGYGKMGGQLVLHVDIDINKTPRVLWGY
tara:strand:+ start:1464 stop:1838 length:375 start_codon:yes stop_codon:yes gene_type:complete